jgi:hypothetical protein
LPRIGDAEQRQRAARGLRAAGADQGHELVERRAGGIEDLADGRFLDSYGIGWRLAFAREAVFRIDLGFSEEGSNFTLAFGNSF